FGYGQAWPSLEAAVVDHLAEAHGWVIESDWIVWLPGLVSGLNIACRAVEGEVLTATPVYPPFLSAPRLAGRTPRQVELIRRNDRWQWDMTALAAAAADTRLFLLCHPHNPVGRCWQEDELRALADFAAERDLVVCSDEIHSGLILDADKRHIPFASLSADAARRSITLLAPSKTFNIPGLACALAVIPDAVLRRRFHAVMAGIVPHVNVLGLAACEAAYRDGEAWRRELISYLAGNRDRVAAAVAACPQVGMSPVEATYLAWIDVRGLGLTDPARHFEKHGLGLSDGADFGAPGWLRLNFGCPRATLDEALRRFATACQAT
ncbi:MAG: PatB family C-S lyase, partial [Betaproteobacteria bacterium]|nr:PatB family C-S lyase [Betaproteobacteria bacterium]